MSIGMIICLVEALAARLGDELAQVQLECILLL